MSRSQILKKFADEKPHKFDKKNDFTDLGRTARAFIVNPESGNFFGSYAIPPSPRQLWFSLTVELLFKNHGKIIFEGVNFIACIHY